MHQTPWNVEFDRSIAAWAEGDFAAGRMACDRLMNHPATPVEYRENARLNAVHYALSLRDVPGYRDWQVEIALPEGWFAFNPSLVAAGNGFVLSARCGNYAMPGWVIAPGDDRYRSVPALVALDAGGRPASAPVFLADLTVGDADRDDRYEGPEDLRLIGLEDRLLASGSVARRVGPERVRTICLGLFDIDLEAGTIGAPRWLGERPGAVEKNWMPTVREGKLHFVYRCGPTTVLSCDPGSGAVRLQAEVDAPLMAAGMRGGTQLLPEGDGWLAVVHESADWEPGKRTYLHRVVRFGPDWRITHLSHPFRFHREELEFAAGLARCGDDLLISFGTGDNACWIARLPEASLTGLLLPVETFGVGRVEEAIPADFRHVTYLGLLDYLHRRWQPDGYLEIGVQHGRSLALATTASVGVDSEPRIDTDIVSGKPWVKVFAQASDDFFAEWTRDQIFGNRRLELTFVDGMHLFEHALRDIMHAEQWSDPDGLILVHDVIPNSLEAASRTFNPGDWEGDVWRVIPALRRWRPDLNLQILSPQEAPHTGMLVISSLNPKDTLLSSHLDRIIAEGLDERIPYEEQVRAFKEGVHYVPVQVFLQDIYQWRGYRRPPSGVAVPPDDAGELTLVSALIDIGNSYIAPEARLAMLGPLFDAGIPLVLFMDASYRDRLDPARVPPWVAIVPAEMGDLETVRRIAAMDPAPGLPTGGVPWKDTREYLSLMNAKTEMVARAVASGMVETPFTGYIDSGVAKNLRDPDGSLRSLRHHRLDRLDRVLIPGCTPLQSLPIEEFMDQVSWHFCGTMFILPSWLAGEFHREASAALDEFLAAGKLVWEVNAWALLAGRSPDLFQWYEADHNDRMMHLPAVAQVLTTKEI